MTGVGMILGTAAYMSPEQAKGQDGRTDAPTSWRSVRAVRNADGASGVRGDSPSEILARVIEREPDWNALPSAVPPRIHELLRRCLEKDPKKRRRDIGDVRVEIDHALSEPEQACDAACRCSVELVPRDSRGSRRRAGRRARNRSRSSVPCRRHRRRPKRVVDIIHPRCPTQRPLRSHRMDDAWCSRRSETDGPSSTCDRSMGHGRAPERHRGASLPFWSPDGRSLGFSVNNQLKRIDLDGGLVQTLANVGTGPGGTWGPDGVILFAPNPGHQANCSDACLGRRAGRRHEDSTRARPHTGFPCFFPAAGNSCSMRREPADPRNLSRLARFP